MELETVIGVVDSNMGSSNCDRGRRFNELKETSMRIQKQSGPSSRHQGCMRIYIYIYNII